jgi:hypothetical protein
MAGGIHGDGMGPLRTLATATKVRGVAEHGIADARLAGVRGGHLKAEVIGVFAPGAASEGLSPAVHFRIDARFLPADGARSRLPPHLPLAIHFQVVGALKKEPAPPEGLVNPLLCPHIPRIGLWAFIRLTR